MLEGRVVRLQRQDTFRGARKLYEAAQTALTVINDFARTQHLRGRLSLGANLIAVGHTIMGPQHDSGRERTVI